MNKTLLLISNHYPEGGKEPFLATEVPLLAQKFDRICIFPLNIVEEAIDVPVNVEVKSLFGSAVSKIGAFKIFLLNVFSFSKILNTESKEGARSMLLKNMINAEKLRDFVKNENLDLNTTLFYSYWLDEGALILALLKKKLKHIKTISRVHGYDLYEEDYSFGLPYFYRFSANSLNAVYCISINGKEYFKKSHSTIDARIEVSYLGTKDYGVAEFPNTEGTFKIATCSSIIELKRLGLLASALALLKIPIEWHHFGDGDLKDDVLKIIARNSFISPIFHGHKKNHEIMNFYKLNPFHLFVNVSRTEGLPVSLMEAASFGNPLFATDVRGTKEVCTNKTGMLVDVNIDIGNLASKIEEALNINWDRAGIRSFWKEKFDSDVNFETFAKKLTEL